MKLNNLALKKVREFGNKVVKLENLATRWLGERIWQQVREFGNKVVK